MKNHPNFFVSRYWLVVLFLSAAFAMSVSAQFPSEAELNGTGKGSATEQKMGVDGSQNYSIGQRLEIPSRLSVEELRFHLPKVEFRKPDKEILWPRPGSGRFAYSNPMHERGESAEVPALEIFSNGLFTPNEPIRPETLRLAPELQRPFKKFLATADFAPQDEPAVSTDDDDPPNAPPLERFHWRPAIKQALLLLGIQHGYALIAQEKTRRALANGNFFTDYWRSVRGLHGWDDGNRFFTNYVAHPMQGGLTGFIFVQNHDRAKRQKFAESQQYWKDRFKALVWSTAWSVQWELGPVGQAAIGNLGLYKGMAFVDLVITPTVGTTWLVTEEAIDRYIIRHIEDRSFVVRLFSRILLNPMRSVANLLRFKHPWYRDRPVGH